jgi:hypothetical protein
LAFSSFEPVLVEVTRGFHIHSFGKHSSLFRRSMLDPLLRREFRFLQTCGAFAMYAKIYNFTHATPKVSSGIVRGRLPEQSE